MCFKITRTQREYYRYRDASAEAERSGYGVSRPELAWANRQRQRELEKTADGRDKGGGDRVSDSAGTFDSN